MTAWTNDELNKIGKAEELEIASLSQRWDAAKACNDLGCSDWERSLCSIS